MADQDNLNNEHPDELLDGIVRSGSIFNSKLSIDALRKSEQFVTNILESIGEGLIVIDPEYRIILANKAYLENVKRKHEDVIGTHCHEISHNSKVPCFKTGEDCPARIAFETGEPYKAEHIHTGPDGNTAYVEVKTYPMKDDDGRTVSVIETINDITLQRKLEDQLRSSQRLEAIGQLAGGIAHDFNNILTAILGYGNLLQMKVDNSNPLRGKIDQIVSSAEKAANLTQSLLAYSRKQILNPRQVKINDIIRKIEKILSRLSGEKIEFKIILTDKEPTIFADSGQLEQVFMNLVTNARDAMPQGGNLTIETGLVDIDVKKYARIHSVITAGSHVLISFTDTGIGMDEVTQEKIFNPFFTTKEVGKGTGLGLAMAYGILRQHHGFIDVFSEPDKGTTFRIFIPEVKTEVINPDASESVAAAGGQ
jgi:PAS domain S-box-containing protein